MRIALGITVSVLALSLGAAGQPRGGGWRGLPGTGIGLAGRPGGRLGYGRNIWPWYGVGYADLSEPYYEEAPQPPPVFVPPVDERVAPAAVMQPKLIELPAVVQKTPSQPSLPTVLLWRNGQRDEINQYTISGGFLYDYSKPRALRKIPLDDLDLDATERANQQRGVQFLIPASPSEVTVRF